MKSFTIATTAALVATTAVVVSASSSVSMEAEFDNFVAKYNKAYKNDNVERAKRFENFKQNKIVAAFHQKRNPLATFGTNEFADLSAAEFKVYHNGEKYYTTKAQSKRFSEKKSSENKMTAVEQIDWRTKGAVTAVKNQGQCGSCWSFSTTGGIEGQWFIAGHTLVSLSEQELVSCDTNDDGCNGGLMDNAFNTIVNSWGGWITGENDYPYVSGGGSVPACSRSGKPKRAQITGHTDVAHSESAMATALAEIGPISIGVDASSWQTYTGGILTNCVSSQVDHGVLLVGMNLKYSTPYWIIKNSWASSWGEDGYIRVGYGSDQCLITSAPCYPHASKGPAPPPGPTPPTPPTPPSPPATGTFTQYQCTNALCMGDCSGNTFNQGQCLEMSGGGSAIATCSATELNLQVYSSSGCTGSATSEQQPLNQCLQDTSGTYIYNTCSGSSSGSGSTPSSGSGSQPSSNSGSSSGFNAERANKVAIKPQFKMANKKKQ